MKTNLKQNIIFTYRIEDLPAPVLPTHPIFYPGVIKNETPLSTGLRSFEYFITTSLNSKHP